MRKFKDFWNQPLKNIRLIFKFIMFLENQDYQELYQQLQEFYGLSSGGFQLF